MSMVIWCDIRYNNRKSNMNKLKDTVNRHSLFQHYFFFRYNEHRTTKWVTISMRGHQLIWKTELFQYSEVHLVEANLFCLWHWHRYEICWVELNNLKYRNALPQPTNINKPFFEDHSYHYDDHHPAVTHPNLSQTNPIRINCMFQ